MCKFFLDGQQVFNFRQGLPVRPGYHKFTATLRSDEIGIAEFLKVVRYGGRPDIVFFHDFVNETAIFATGIEIALLVAGNLQIKLQPFLMRQGFEYFAESCCVHDFHYFTFRKLLKRKIIDRAALVKPIAQKKPLKNKACRPINRASRFWMRSSKAVDSWGPGVTTPGSLCFDGSVKRPIFALRVTPRHCEVLKVRLIPRDSQDVSRTFYEAVGSLTVYQCLSFWCAEKETHRSICCATVKPCPVQPIRIDATATYLGFGCWAFGFPRRSAAETPLFRHPRAGGDPGFPGISIGLPPPRE